MSVPDLHQHRETNGESRKAFHDLDQVVKGVRHFQRDDQQSYRESEDGIAKSFQTGDFSATPTEAFFFWHYSQFLQALPHEFDWNGIVLKPSVQPSSL